MAADGRLPEVARRARRGARRRRSSSSRVDLLGRAGRLAAVVLPRPRRPARATITSSTGSRRFLVGLACFAFAWFNTGPKKHAAYDRRRRVRSDQLLPGRDARAAPGRLGALPGLEPRAQRHPPEARRLEHPPEPAVLPHLPRRAPPRDRARAARGSSGRTGCGSSRASAARSATARSATIPTRSSAGCSSSARSRPGSSA